MVNLAREIYPTSSSSSSSTAADPVKYPLVVFHEVEEAFKTFDVLPQKFISVPIDARENIFIKFDALDEIKAETRCRIYHFKTNYSNLFSPRGRDAVRKEVQNLSQNPLQAEEQVSNAIIDASPPPQNDNVEMKMYVKLDSTMAEELPTMHLVFQGVYNAKSFNYYLIILYSYL